MKIKKINNKTNKVLTNQKEDNELNKIIPQGDNELMKTNETNTNLKKTDWFVRIRDILIIFFILLSFFTQFCEKRIPFANYEPKTFPELTSHEVKNAKPKEVKNEKTNSSQEQKTNAENNKKNK
ncbi:MAG: hypothetical protein Q8894_02195 [Sweet potato little leaf phytoplasma]|nr:hypothetical protein [Pigeon pea little leaf phytoplasma]MDV3204576.1 hypothetical protein [Sweet potato little leaf phytoplasma]